AGMPMPVSCTETVSITVSGVTASVPTCTATSPRSVNLIALPTRLRTIWLIRPVSPMRSSGTSGLISYASSSPLAWASGASVLSISPTASPQPEGTGRPALRAGEGGGEKKPRPPDHAVHWGADLVAHGGQEFRLRPVCRFGRRFLLLERADVAHDREL